MKQRDSLFVYGTLQIPEVMGAVTGRAYAGETAYIENYARYRVRGKAYPGLRPEAGVCTIGVLYRELDAAALRRLDAFEDDFYRRETLPVRSADGRKVPAEVYVVKPERYRILLPRPWSLERFQAEALTDFMPRCRRAGA